MRRCLAILVVSLVLVPSSAAAHSSSVEATPRNGATLKTLPTVATVTMNEAPKTAAAVLRSPDRKVHKLSISIVGSTITARLPAKGPRGAYSLSYRVVSADGHPVSGSVRFTVTSGPAPSSPAPDAAPTARPAEPPHGPLVPVVIGVALLGVIATAFAARSMRR